MPKEQQNKNYQIISVILFLAFIVLVGLYFTKTAPAKEINEITCADFIEDCSEIGERAMLTSELMSWNENLYDNTEMFYTFNIYNYGDSEAKDIEVTCKSWEYSGSTEKLIAKVTDSFGNLASNSYKQYELLTANVPIDINNEYVSVCYVESCNNCEILYKKIPELVNAFATD